MAVDREFMYTGSAGPGGRKTDGRRTDGRADGRKGRTDERAEGTDGRRRAEGWADFEREKNDVHRCSMKKHDSKTIFIDVK